PVVLHFVESPNNLFEVHAPAPRRTEVPTPPRVAEVEVTAEDARPAVKRYERILDVHVINAVRELANKLDRVHTLPNEMARIEVESELLAVTDGLECPLGRIDIERDFGRVHFEREPHAAIAEYVEDRIPPLGELLVAFVDHRIRHGRERIQKRPNARAREAV